MGYTIPGLGWQGDVMGRSLLNYFWRRFWETKDSMTAKRLGNLEFRLAIEVEEFFVVMEVWAVTVVV